MRDMVFAMELRGQAGPVEGREGSYAPTLVAEAPWVRPCALRLKWSSRGRRSRKAAGSNTVVGARCTS